MLRLKFSSAVSDLKDWRSYMYTKNDWPVVHVYQDWLTYGACIPGSIDLQYMYTRIYWPMVHVYQEWLTYSACIPGMIDLWCMYTRIYWPTVHAYQDLLTYGACISGMIDLPCMYTRIYWPTVHVYQEWLTCGALLLWSDMWSEYLTTCSVCISWQPTILTGHNQLFALWSAWYTTVPGISLPH